MLLFAVVASALPFFQGCDSAAPPQGCKATHHKKKTAFLSSHHTVKSSTFVNYFLHFFLCGAERMW